jgi:hypothetical protein
MAVEVIAEEPFAMSTLGTAPPALAPGGQRSIFRHFDGVVSFR